MSGMGITLSPALPTEKEKPIGIYGQRHLRYLKECHSNTYTNLLASGRLNIYLADIDKQARERFETLVGCPPSQADTIAREFMRYDS